MQKIPAEYRQTILFFLCSETYEQKSIFAFSGNMCYKCLYMKFEKLCREPVYDLRIFIMVS